jgi:predicted RNA-binding Zn-ribbon protein involved in translation (DUF1610 family)
MPNPDNPPGSENEGPTREYPRVVSREPVVGDQPIECPKCPRCGEFMIIRCDVTLRASRNVHHRDFCGVCANEVLEFISVDRLANPYLAGERLLAKQKG